MLNALASVALLIGLGFALRSSGFLPQPAWATVDRLVYYVMFPALLVSELAAADLADMPVPGMAASLLAAQSAMAALASRARKLLHLDGPAYTSVLQCVVRSNTYVALALTPALIGAEGMALVALAIAIMVPAANLMSVAALSRHGAAGRTGVLAFARAVATNPLIVACLVGIGVNAAAIELPTLLREALAMLGEGTLALGLLTVGAGLRPNSVLDRPGLIALTTSAHLLLRPALGATVALMLGLGGVAVDVVALACAVPTATSSYILARLLGGDAELMAALVTTTTVAALATLPAVMAVAQLVR